MISRRGLLSALPAFLAAPAIVRVGNLMPVKAWEETPTTWIWDGYGWVKADPSILPAGGIGAPDWVPCDYSRPILLPVGINYC